ncbi:MULTISPECIES: efflux RND transporter periplasmic adaptor subunit [Acutalibacteraceae]|uniref:efflux RND transporter periplasmic adaptor subunit n=1 Tax=Acutalibacteraceae TaxID=3082771 RepID=UPI0013E8CA9D|nr:MULTISPECIES: efflux RND transporter periplasmic adaptor subunit [Acutalibacteraceae]
MKRYLLLFAFTLIAAATIFTAGNTMKNSILKLDVTKMEPVQEVESVTCTGKVELSSNGNVYAPAHSIVQRVYVSSGQKVEVGQALMEVDVLSDGEDDSQETDASSYLEQESDLPRTQTIAAPVSGTVSSVSVTDAGYYIDPTQPAVVIRNSSGLQVRLNVNESQISDIKVGQKAEITGVGFKSSSYSGKVKEISSEAKQVLTTSGQETVVEAVVSVTDVKEDIKPGFTAKVKIITSSDSSVLVAPYSAVQADQDGSEYVLRVVGGKATKTLVQTGREFDSGFEIKSGVSKDDRIVTDAEDIPDGARVVPVIGKAVSAQ